MRLFVIVLICIIVLFLMLSYYKKSKYQRSANIPNGIVSLICMAVIFLSPVFTEPLNLSTSGEAITISQNGNIQIYEIDGQDTKNQSITVDIGKMYLNVLLVDRTYQDLFEGFTFSEKANITYGLYYNEVSDGFYLYRNFGQAMGVDIWAFVALILLTYNLVLMVLRVLRLKNDPEESSVYKASSLQRMVNMLERSSMIAFSAIGLGYLLSIFITPKIGFLYYFTDAQYLLFISAVLLLPLLISIVVELFHRNYSVEFENHIINIYEKKELVFSATDKELEYEEQFLRDGSSYGRNYHTMNINFSDLSGTYQGLQLNVKSFGLDKAFQLVEKLRIITYKNKADVMVQDANTNERMIVLTGIEKKNATSWWKYLWIIPYMVGVFCALVFSADLVQELGVIGAVILIVMVIFIPMSIIIFTQVQKQKQIKPIKVILGEQFIDFDDTLFLLEEEPRVILPYPVDTVAGFTLVRIRSKNQERNYLIKRNPKIPKDEYYDFYSLLSIMHPKIMKIK